MAINLDYPTEQIVLRVAQQLFVLLSQHATQGLGTAILSSGLIGRKDQKSLARLLRAACLGSYRAILAELEVIQKEAQNATKPS